MKRVSGWFVACTLLVGACGLVTGVNDKRNMGAIGYPDDLEIGTPASAAVGQPFTITVRTLGADGCWKSDGTDVAIAGLGATVTPYDVQRVSGGTDCTQMPVEIAHTAELTFGTAGTGRITIRGRDGTVVRNVTVQ